MIGITLGITQRIKQSMKKSIALHFARSIYVKENPDTDLFSTSEKVKVKIHSVNMIPIAWLSYVSKEIVRLKIQVILLVLRLSFASSLNLLYPNILFRHNFLIILCKTML